MKRRGRPPYPDLLTPREQEVLALLREGLSNEQIAERLGVSLAGAKYHVSEILGKLGVSSREEAARWQQRERPWWLGAFAPIASLRHRLGWAPQLAIATTVVALAAGAGLLLWGLTRTNGDDSKTTPSTDVKVPEGLSRLVFQPGETISADGPGIFYIDSKTGAAEGWFVPGGGIFEFSVTAYSADGRFVLYTCRELQAEGSPIPCETGQEPGTWFLLDTQIGERTQLRAGLTRYISISPDGGTLLAEVGRGELVLFDISNNYSYDSIGAGITPEVQGLARGGIDWSPDSSAGVVRSPDGALYLLEVETVERTQLTSDPYGGTARWSPDSSKIAVARNPNPDSLKNPAPPGTPGILVFSRRGELLWQSTLPGGNARWSPDSRRLVVDVDPPRKVTPEFARDSRLDIFDGDTGETLFRIDGVIACAGEVWNADGSKLLFGSFNAEPPFQSIGDPATGIIASVPAAGIPSPSDPNLLIGFDGSNFTRVDLTTDEVTLLATTAPGLEPAWYSDHEPLFAGSRLIFAAPHGGHGGCGEGLWPDTPPPLEFQFPPFLEP